MTMIPFLHTPPSSQILCHILINGIIIFTFPSSSHSLIPSSSHPLYAKDGLPLGTISMNPLSLSHIRIGVCTLAKTFFCGWGPQKHEWGAPRFLQSSIRHTLPLSAGFWPSTQHTPYSPAIRMAFRPSVRRLRKKHPVGCLPLNSKS